MYTFRKHPRFSGPTSYLRLMFGIKEAYTLFVTKSKLITLVENLEGITGLRLAMLEMIFYTTRQQLD